VNVPEWSTELATNLAVRFLPTPEEIDALEAEAESLSTSAAQDEAETEANADEAATSEQTESDQEAEAAETSETDDESVITSGITVDQLRARVRHSLELQAKREADRDYAEGVLNAIVQNAAVGYPEAMMQDQLDRMVQSLDQRLRQQGMTLEMYQSITGKTRDDLYSDYREAAADSIKRSLVLLEVAVKENLKVSPDDFEAEVTNMMQMFGGGSPELRKTFDSPSFRESIYNRILQDKTYDRLTLIGKGEAPELPAPEAAASEENADAVAVTDTVASDVSVSETDNSTNG
jgi:FKBP-type peptidyl-prolyl cis-trans isomerase (trigger factor)